MTSLDKQQEFSGVEFKRLVLPGGRVFGIEFADCTFSRCTLREVVFEECKFYDCTFRGCDLSLARFPGCSFKSTRFEDSTLAGVDWTETTWPDTLLVRPVGFSRCALNHSTFIGLSLKQIELARCVARDCDFEQADLTQANCTFTDFANSRFYHTDLTEADFSGATNYAIAAHLNSLKKTRFSLPEAMSLLHSLDIVLTEISDHDDPSF